MRRFALPPRATLDYETRSACNLKTHGTWKYSVDPSTQILCLVFRLPHWPKDELSVWHPAMPSIGLDETGDADKLAELFAWIASDGLIEAHNSFFEFCIWQNIQVPQYGWPEIPFAQWRCSAAKCAAHALPRKLEDAAKALRLKNQKDVDGAKLMMKMTKPRKARKAERLVWAKAGTTPPRRLWHESPEQLDRLIMYCSYDVLTEEAISESLPDLSPDEQQMFQMDLELNVAGFQIDQEAVTAALTLIHRESIILNQELSQITEGKVRKATQRQKMLAWFESQHFALPDTKKDTIDGILETHPRIPWKVKRALEVIRTLGRSSTAKYQAMKHWAAKDGRVRGGMLYHGATTGRWSGKGVQPHNFPKGGLFTPEGKPIKLSMDELWDLIKAGHRPDIRKKVRNVMEALATALRGAITAGPGQTLFVADYASIEARVLLWLAEDEEHLQIFRDHRDIYCEMASSIYGYPCSKETPTERAMGKIAILGLGYQMGAGKFLDTCAKFGITIEEEFSQQVVDAYRAKFWRVKQLWKAQEQAAIAAVRAKGSTVRCGRVCWIVEGTYLYCKLPSGRRLSYPFPLVQRKETPWGVTEGLTFMGVDGYTHRWKRQTTYGGMIVENIVQAIARDLMAYAMLRAQAEGTYHVILSVHDELVAEAQVGTGSVGEFEALMAECPDWAGTCPVEAEGWHGFRYHK